MLHCCIVLGECALAQGELACELACVQGGALCVVWASDVSSRCPCLRGPRLVLLQVMLLFAFPLAFDRLLEFLLVISFLLLFSLVTKCVCYQCTHLGGDWGQCVVRGLVDGRFLVWWVIDNVVWTDSWLSIAGAGCGLTGVGAGEEQAWKVVDGEALQVTRRQVGLVRGT
jgi:hypothetical protein